MPILTSLLLIAQAATVPTIETEAFKKVIAANGDNAGRYIECIDSAARDSIKKHMGDASPEVTWNEAADSCKSVENEMRANAVASFLPFMGAAQAKQKADQLTDSWLTDIRTKSVSFVDGMLASKGLAESRLQITSFLWGECVRKKVHAWAKLKDEAASIATAAVSACRVEQRNQMTAFGYQMRARGFSASLIRLSQDMEPNLVQTMKDSAIQWVIEARAAPAPLPTSARAKRNSVN